MNYDIIKFSPIEAIEIPEMNEENQDAMLDLIDQDAMLDLIDLNTISRPFLIIKTQDNAITRTHTTPIVV